MPVRTPDPVLLNHAVRTFMKTDADPAYLEEPGLGGGLATQGPTVNYWFLL